MNDKLIEQIKKLEGVKEVRQLIPNQVVVIFEPKEPVLHDEYGVPLFEGDKYFWTQSLYDHNFYMEVMIPGGNIISRAECNNSFAKGVKIFASEESCNRWIEDNKPKPIYIDPETGDEFYENEEYWYFNKDNYKINHVKLARKGIYLLENELLSKIYKTRDKCEIALADFIAKKHNKRIIDNK